MKTNLSILILLLGICLNAQIRIEYELEYKIDSTSDFVELEVFNLDIEDNISKFYPRALATMDSLVNSGNYLYNDKVVEPKLDYMIEKKGKEVFFQETIAMNIFNIKEPRQLDWQIIPNSIDSISQYQVQKAETLFGGRKWTAYYTNEIAYSDGPYKFYGLPGLILRIYDQEKDYFFDLVSVKKIDKAFNFTFYDKIGVKKIDIDFNKYQNIVSEIETNPQVISYLMTGSFDVVLPSEIGDQFVERYKNNKLKKNNPIELSLNE